MDIVKTIGRMIDDIGETRPQTARRLLRIAWEAQDLKLRLAPDRRLGPANQFLAHMMMDCMLWPLKDPANAVLVSIFTPCELMQEAGLHPYNVEGFSSYLAGTKAERAFLQGAEDLGLSETLCSYHKTFIGAALSGLMPRPKCIVYTNLACDANLLTFKTLARYYDVPSFVIDVGAAQTEANVAYVAGELKELKSFLELHTGHKINEDKLSERVEKSYNTLLAYDNYQKLRAGKYIPSDIVSPLYCGMTNNLLSGTDQEEHFIHLLYEDLKTAPPAKGKSIYWMHTIPFWSKAVKDKLFFNENAVIVCCELSQPTDLSHHSSDPYEAMAMRLVYHSMNGSVERRIDAGIRHAKESKADGAVWFNQWGCKHTAGGSRLAKKRFDQAGIPLLVLDGDSCDRSFGGEGQTATRLGAFLEMLG